MDFQKIVEKKKAEKKTNTQSTTKTLSGAEKRKAIYEELIYNAYIPQRFKEKTLKNYEVNPKDKNYKIFTQVLEFKNNIDKHYKNGDWLLLIGGYGLGKTHLAIGLLKEVAWWLAGEYVIRRKDYPVSIIKKKENVFAVQFQNITDLLNEIKKAYNSHDINEDEVIWKYQTRPFLVIDDLGAEKSSEWQQEKLYSILDYRYREMKTTVITTNFSMGELVDRVSQRVVERIHESAVKLGLEGESYRMGGIE